MQDFPTPCPAISQQHTGFGWCETEGQGHIVELLREVAPPARTFQVPKSPRHMHTHLIRVPELSLQGHVCLMNVTEISGHLKAEDTVSAMSHWNCGAACFSWGPT